ncbi:MAG: hypothetical protein U1D30_15965 [Planctomycetota bacterium]
MANTPRQRLTLRNLDLPQKVLVLTILATIGLGYLGALANLFSQVAGADGRQTVELTDFTKTYREKGLGGLLQEIQNSLGMDDVIRTYHGLGAGTTRLEAALNGTMRTKMLEYYSSDENPDEETKKQAEQDRQALIAWSHLPFDRREKAYEEGVPLGANGAIDWKAFEVFFQEKKGDEGEKPELSPIIADAFNNACVSCHSAAGDDQARSLPLETFREIDSYCVEDRGMSYKQLALTTHVHLLGFSVLFAMTGFLFSLTSYSRLLRLIFVPWTLFFQLLEIVCWWGAKTDVLFAKAIFYLGPLVGIGLGVQILGTFIDLVIRRPDRDLED